ncbi:MAG: hypothetical protein KatS3mg089_0565 [Patescibacteria group bacterium]|nr:MAG: hypothetical protein KatS3mg089_0565 [Patescibacteria group bacterium]
MATKKSLPLHKRGYHKKLEEPVHNLVGYIVLFALALVVLVLVYSLQWFIVQ